MRFKPPVWLFVAAVGLGTRGILALGQAPEAVDPSQALAAPTVVPAAPVLSHSVVGTTVFLTWSPAATGGVPTGYVVEASLSAGGAAMTAFPVAVTALTVPNVPAGTYFVRVRAVNGDGSGPPSNEVTVVVGAPCAQPPGAPGPLVASVSGATVTLSWSPPTGGCPATQFVLRAGFAPGQVVFNIPVGSNTSFSGTAAPGTYFVSVAAVNAAGQGPPSNEERVTLGCEAPGPPVGLTPNVNGRTVALSWSPPSSGGAPALYRLEAGFSSGATDVSFDLPTNAFSTAAPDGTYFVRVRSVNACGVSPPSNEATVVVPNCGPTPGAPSTPTAMVNGGAATISWSAVNGASSYRLEVGTSSGASNVTSQLVSGTSRQLTNLSSGNYFMRVRALNACGSAGPASGEGSFTVVATPPTLTRIDVTGPGSLVIGQSGQFTATARFSDGASANVTTSATWASSNGTVAALSSAGIFNARGVGTANITASRDGQTGTAALQVVPPTASFVVDPNPCRVTDAPNTAQNHLLCTFDGRASTANATYAWEIPAGSGRCGDNPCPNSNVVDGRTLRYGCGSFGGAGRFPVRLRVTFGGVTVEQTQMIQFDRFQAC
jgi:predicted phage tail protein